MAAHPQPLSHCQRESASENQTRPRTVGRFLPSQRCMDRRITRGTGDFLLGVQTPCSALELSVGWAAHYLIGIVFVWAFVTAAGDSWRKHPTLAEPIIFGLLTLAMPFLVLQPAMEAGVAARKTPRPWISRGRSAAAHLAFGVGFSLARDCSLGLIDPDPLNFIYPNALPIICPMRTAPPGAQSGLNFSVPLGHSSTTVEPSRKRPISAPLANSTGWLV